MAAIGFTVKSGWAAAVVVDETRDAIRVLDSRRVELCDPASPASKQPYHDGFATMRQPGAMLAKLVAAVQQFGERSVLRVLSQARGEGAQLSAAGVVVGSLIDPLTIGNEHIRIHAMEGKLFREVIIGAVEKHGLRCAVWRERDVIAVARKALRRSEASLRRTLDECGSTRQPWRAEQKSATLAAWLVLRRAG